MFQIKNNPDPKAPKIRYFKAASTDLEQSLLKAIKNIQCQRLNFQPHIKRHKNPLADTMIKIPTEDKSKHRKNNLHDVSFL